MTPSERIRAAALSLVLLLLVGCNGPVERAVAKKRGDARLVVFRECMELAAKLPRQADDDVSDVVAECAQSAYYMTNYIGADQ